MQIYIEHDAEDGLLLPMSYNYILQSIIYHALEKGGADISSLHDKGWQYEKRQYRLFQFSGISGHYQRKEDRILFDQKVAWEIRAADSRIIQAIAGSLAENGVNYFGKKYVNVGVSVSDKSVETEELEIRMKTPICVYETDVFTGKTLFFRPDQENFYRQVNDNFKRKYKAFTGIDPGDGIKILPQNVSLSDKVITKYKGFYLSGWKGTYFLTGQRKYLDFLYQTGLGSKNSQGFGMFEF